MVKLIPHNYVYMVLDPVQKAILFASTDSEKVFMNLNRHKRNGNSDARMVSAPMNIDIYKALS